jgi:putative heme iron utilization protein
VDKKVLSAEEILGANDLEPVEVEVPEWGGVVRLRPMTAEQVIEYQEKVKSGDKRHGAIIMVGMCVVNEDNEPAFTEVQVRQLGKKSLAALQRIQRAALKINGLDDKGEKDVKND